MKRTEHAEPNFEKPEPPTGQRMKGTKDKKSEGQIQQRTKRTNYKGRKGRTIKDENDDL